MYNLFISGDDEAWEGQPYELEVSRVFEHTDSKIEAQFKELDQHDLDELKKLPCLFAYEIGSSKSPKYGKLTTIKKRQNKVIIAYEIAGELTGLTEELLKEKSLNFDINPKYELRRTHWAVKDVDLDEELTELGISVPKVNGRIVDINKHHFDIAFSFPGDARGLVEPIVQELTKKLKPHALFYDFNYQSQLARPSLDILLQDIYGNRSKLIVVFLSGDYERKKWCGVEFRAIRQVIMDQKFDKVMLIKVDDEPVSGIFSTDGYIDSRRYTPDQIAQFIIERSEHHK